MFAFLQLSWLFAKSLTIWTVRPDQAPTCVVGVGEVGTTYGPEVPPIVKSASVHSGRPLAKLVVNACTDAVMWSTVTEPGFGLMKSPESATAGPPGYRPVTVFV